MLNINMKYKMVRAQVGPHQQQSHQSGDFFSYIVIAQFIIFLLKE